MPTARPSWCSSVARDGRTLVVAPHGGLCARDLLDAATAGTLRGNDLHTAGVARELAERLDASLIANVAVDRNELDLNRIDEVASGAPWFFDLMAERIAAILQRHPAAQVLVVHGWHVIQPRCDLGVGARLAEGHEAHAVASRLTVSPDYVLGALEALRAAGEPRGIHTTFGERWPAAHRNNVLQLFRRTRPPRAPAPPRALAELVATGRVQAVQLELGAPLRWPGRWRRRFLDGAAAAFAAPAARDERRGAAPRAVRRAPATMTPPAAPPPRSSLQAYDPAAGAAGLAVVAGIGALSRDELGARLLLMPGGQRMLLFTGHARVAGGGIPRVGGLEIAPHARGSDVRFRGPVLDVPDASRYFRDEETQLGATLAELELTLHFTSEGAGAFGRVTGRAVLDGVAWDLATHGFTEPVLARPAASSGDGIRLTASLGATGLLADVGASGGVVREFAPRDAPRAAAVAPGAPLPEVLPGVLAAPFDVPLEDGRTLRCRPRSHVTILRAAAEGAFARITFGTAAFAVGDRSGGGFYEHTTMLP